jgi:hypothetical protein
MSLTYAQLSTAIQQYTQVNETSFIANIPNFVQNTEVIVNNAVQLPASRQTSTLTATAGSQYLTLPTGFLSMFSLAVSSPTEGYVYLLNKDVNYITEAYPYQTARGLPVAYALNNASQMILGPIPNSAYSLVLNYYAYPQSIVTAGTSWLGENFSNVLLWGSITEAYIYLKGEADLIQTYQAKFQEALAELKQLVDGKDRGDTYRRGQVRDMVT